MRKILLTLVIVSLVAMPAFAAVQNIKVSGSIDSSYVSRTNFNLQTDSLLNDERNNANFFMTQTELKVEADLTDNVSTTVALINERAWGEPSDSGSEIDLNLAFVTLKEMLYSPLTVVIGRQAFSYGNSFIFSTGAIGGEDSGIPSIASDLSKQKGLDAIRAILDYNPLKLEMFYGKIDSNDTDSSITPNSKDDVDVAGIVGTYDFGDAKKSAVEAYVFAKADRSINRSLHPSVIPGKTSKLYVPGIRVSTNPIEKLYTSLEYAHQMGQKYYEDDSIPPVNGYREDVSANAVQFIAVYQLPVAEKYTPVLSYDYTYTSGDERIGSSKKAWDPFFENQNNGKIYNVLFEQSNSHVQSLGLQVNPMEDVTTKLSWTNLRLDKSFSASTIGGSGYLKNANVTTNKALGNEIDFDVKYAYTEDVTIGANLGWFMPGKSFEKPERNQVASQAIVNVNVNF